MKHVHNHQHQHATEKQLIRVMLTREEVALLEKMREKTGLHCVHEQATDILRFQIENVLKPMFHQFETKGIDGVRSFITNVATEVVKFPTGATESITETAHKFSEVHQL
jgi:hypothetical protein